jgi:hypothetical protein
MTINLTGSQVANQQLVPTKDIQRQKAVVVVVVDTWGLVMPLYPTLKSLFATNKADKRQIKRLYVANILFATYNLTHA